MKRNFLTIKHLTKKYNSRSSDSITALNNINISVDEGDFVSIVGSNAAGKTTLFKLLVGAIIPTSGKIFLDGTLLSKFDETQRAKIISCVRQNPGESVINSMSVAENLTMAKLKNAKYGLNRGVKHEWKVKLKLLLKPFRIGLEKRLDYRVENLSGGQKQIIALLMATLTKPKLLLLDEHTAALDPKISKLILKITDELVRKNKITTLMITHNVDQAIRYGNRLILLEKGKITFEVCGKKKQSLTASCLEKHFRRRYG